MERRRSSTQSEAERRQCKSWVGSNGAFAMVRAIAFGIGLGVVDRRCGPDYCYASPETEDPSTRCPAIARASPCWQRISTNGYPPTRIVRLRLRAKLLCLNSPAQAHPPQRAADYSDDPRVRTGRQLTVDIDHDAGFQCTRGRFRQLAHIAACGRV